MIIRNGAYGLLACLSLVSAGASAQSDEAKWVQVSVDKGVVMAVDTASIRAEGSLRTIGARLSSTNSPRSIEMSFAVDCAAKTIGLGSEARTYDNGKLVGTEEPPEDARAQQQPDGGSELEKVIALACAADL
jgi:hypothetical protein